MIQNEFERFEKKYLLSAGQTRAVQAVLAERMQKDTYGSYTICSVYYDTDDFRVIRASLEKPVYKEKLRVRAYGVPGKGDTVFVELKKKFRGKVFKRRVPMTLQEAQDFLCWGIWPEAGNHQVLEEIAHFLEHYEPEPKVFLAYDRQAYRGEDNLRITLDENIRWRAEDVDLGRGDYGDLLLPEGQTLMEVKAEQAVPYWLAHCLSQLQIFPISYSKYGTVYQNNLIGAMRYV